VLAKLLLHAVEKQDSECVKAICENYPLEISPNLDGGNPILIVLRNKDIYTLEVLVEHCPEVAEHGEYLIYACQEDAMTCAVLLTYPNMHKLIFYLNLSLKIKNNL